MSRIRTSIAACAVSLSCLCATSPVFAQAQAQPAAIHESSSVSGFFKTTLNDFRNLPSKDTLTVLGVGGVVAATGHMKDREVSNGFSASRMGGTFEAGETVGGARAQFAGALATYAFGRVSGNTRVASVGSDLIRSQILAQAMTAGIKLSARRHRPDGGEFSFPSGHSSVSFATATVLQRNFGWKAGIPAYGLATYVAASRVNVKRHFFSDVAFGAAIGIVAGRTVTVGRGRARFAVSPTASPNHAGVSFALLD